MESDQEDEVPNVNFVPSLIFVKRGVAKANPDKVTLTPAELARIINETREELVEDGVDEMESTDDEETKTVRGDYLNRQADWPLLIQMAQMKLRMNTTSMVMSKKSERPGLHLSTVAVIDPEENIQDDEDSDAEDEIIKPTDNLILVGHVQNDSASMEVYIFNEEEGSMYVHHDFLLPSPPLCIEWLSFDPGSDNRAICVQSDAWNLSLRCGIWIFRSLEPVCKLGSKGSRKKNLPSWATPMPCWIFHGTTSTAYFSKRISGIKPFILWDLEEATPHTTIRDFEEKVQTLAFHPKRAEMLLAGSCDGKVKVFDCRSTTDDSSSYKVWDLGGEVERVCWDHFNQHCFVPARMMERYTTSIVAEERPLWSKEMHEQEVTGLVLSAQIKGMLSTASADGTLKVWDITSQDARMVYKKNPKIGVIQCLDACNESPFTLAMGGDLKTHNFSVVNLLDNDVVSNVFKSRYTASKPTGNIEPPTEEMEDASIDDE
uniref:WD repeat-containing protein 55 homolog n=1 Tax=Anopheles funestus TaxID=62324 RepID=A0A182RXF8_ANOFN